VVFLSLGLRALVNVEAMNMVESVGNIVRHRKAAVVYKREGGYVVRWVPAVSGESIAHSYQAWLASLALNRRLPVCDYCEKMEFVKHADPRIFGEKPWEKELKALAESVEAEEGGGSEEESKSKRRSSKKAPKGPQVLDFMHTFEKTLVENCVVEDIGGFLYARGTPVKRTSRFATSYMIPALDAVERAVVESQFQVRHAPTAGQMWDQAQMPYNVEVGSAVYALSLYIDLASVGCTSAVKRECLPLEKRKERAELAIDALALMLDERIFGAKQTRFNPILEYEVVLVSLSDPVPFNVSPPASGPGFVQETVERSRAFESATKSEVTLFAYAKEKSLVDEMKGIGIKVYPTLLDMFREVKSAALEKLR